MTPHPKRSCATAGVEMKRACYARCGNLGDARGRLAEQKPESWPGGTKLSRRCHREVELKRVR